MELFIRSSKILSHPDPKLHCNFLSKIKGKIPRQIFTNDFSNASKKLNEKHYRGDSTKRRLVFYYVGRPGDNLKGKDCAVVNLKVTPANNTVN